MTHSPADSRRAKNLWMRAVSFVALRELAALITEHAGGLRAGEMEALVETRPQLRTRQGRLPSKTTVYQYRNILMHLEVISRRQGYYQINYGNPTVEALLASMSPGSPTLLTEERRFFAQLVVANQDCRQHFFDLFLHQRNAYDLDDFIASGQRVSWTGGNDSQTQNRQVRLYSLEDQETERWLCTEDEIQAILYGVRYWARNELGFLDELYLEDLGGVMFPVEIEGPTPDPSIIRAFLKEIDESQAWTMLSIRDLAYRWGPRHHVPLQRIYGTLEYINRANPEFVIFIPTAEAFATITASSPGSEVYQLRSYLQDRNGRYISHLRVHRKIKEILR